MAWIWEKCHYTMCVKDALKANIKGHLSPKMEQQGLQKNWRLCIPMCASQWKQHLLVEHDTLLHSLMTFRKHMFIFWKSRNKCLTNSKDTRCWKKMKQAWRSRSCNSTMEENLCPKNLMCFWVNVKSNNNYAVLSTIKWSYKKC